MIISDLTYEQRRRFRKAPVCPICNSFIEDYDSFEFIATNFNRCKVYTFIHKVCLKKFHEKILHEDLVVDNQEV